MNWHITREQDARTTNNSYKSNRIAIVSDFRSCTKNFRDKYLLPITYYSLPITFLTLL